MKTPVEVVQAAYAAFGRGDVPAFLDLLADNVEWKFIGPKGLPYSKTCHGKAAVGQWFASVAEADEIQAFEPREFIAGGNKVAVLGWERTKAKPAGRVFEAEWAHVFTVSGGRIVRFWGLMDTEANAEARR